MINVVEAVKTAERCQRNWDFSRPVKQEDIEKIIGVATNMPTKNNRPYYEIIVSTNLDFNKMCYTHSIDKNNPHFNNRKIHRNTQVNAPLLMIWRATDDRKINDPFNDDFKTSFLVSVGISSAAAVLTANSLGYRTGYCQCIQQDDLFNDIERNYSIPMNDASDPSAILVGIGHPDDNFSRVQCVVDGEHGFTAESNDKQINVKYVK